MSTSEFLSLSSMQRAPSPEDEAETQVAKRARVCSSKKVVVDERRLREMESTVSCIERRTMYHGISPVEVVRQLIEIWETYELIDDLSRPLGLMRDILINYRMGLSLRYKNMSPLERHK